MRFSRKIKAENDDLIMNIHLKVNTRKDYFTKRTSKQKFRDILEEVMKSITDNFYYEQIKVRR